MKRKYLPTPTDIKQEECNDMSLLQACDKGDIATVKMLLASKKCDLELTNDNGETALLVACREGYSDIVSLLIKANANLNCTDKLKQTPLHRLAYGNNHAKELLSLALAKNTESINVQCYSKETPLFLAVLTNQIEKVQILLATKKCDLALTNAACETAFAVALRMEFNDIYSLLINALDSFELDNIDNNNDNQMLTFNSVYTGKYTVDLSNSIGSGAFSIVYTGTYGDQDEMKVAVKRTKPKSSTCDPIKICSDEIVMLETIAQLLPSYPVCMLKCFGWRKENFSLTKPHHYIDIVFELIVGGTLKDMLPKINWDIFYPVVNHIITALNYLHEKNIVHCDVKSANILVQQNVDGTLQGKLGDFGLAQKIPDYSFTAAKLHGSKLYYAPELHQGEKPSPASDVFAFGFVMYEAANGKTLSTMCKKNGLTSHQKLAEFMIAGSRLEIDPNANAPEKIQRLYQYCCFFKTQTVKISVQGPASTPMEIEVMVPRPNSRKLAEETSTPINVMSEEIKRYTRVR